MSISGDPGWRPVLRNATPLRQRSPGVSDPATILRTLWMAFFAAIPLYGLVLWLIHTSVGSFELWPEGVIAALGIVALVLVKRLRFRVGLPADVGELLVRYRSRLFLAVAIADIPLLIGFVLTFPEKEIAPFLSAVPFTVAALLAAAPSRANFLSLDTSLRTQGVTLSLAEAMAGTAPDAETGLR